MGLEFHCQQETALLRLDTYGDKSDDKRQCRASLLLRKGTNAMWWVMIHTGGWGCNGEMLCQTLHRYFYVRREGTVWAAMSFLGNHCLAILAWCGVLLARELLCGLRRKEEDTVGGLGAHFQVYAHISAHLVVFHASCSFRFKYWSWYYLAKIYIHSTCTVQCIKCTYIKRYTLCHTFNLIFSYIHVYVPCVHVLGHALSETHMYLYMVLTHMLSQHI